MLNRRYEAKLAVAGLTTDRLSDRKHCNEKSDKTMQEEEQENHFNLWNASVRTTAKLSSRRMYIDTGKLVLPIVVRVFYFPLH